MATAQSPRPDPQQKQLVEDITKNRSITNAIFGAVVFTGMVIIHQYFVEFNRNRQIFKQYPPRIRVVLQWMFWSTCVYYSFLGLWLIFMIQIGAHYPKISDSDKYALYHRWNQIMKNVLLFVSIVVIGNFLAWNYGWRPHLQKRITDIDWDALDKFVVSIHPMILLVITLLLACFGNGWMGEAV